MVKVKIDIQDNGDVKYDMDGFQGSQCDTWMDDLEARLAKNHGIEIEDKKKQRKAAYGVGVQQNNRLTQGGGQ